jgi:CheY-like chemotaxis protein
MENQQTAVEISVKDSGIGIPDEKRDEIFVDFKQVDNSNNRRYQGTGLGLAISKQLAEIQGGTIEVKSNQPHGSMFLVNLKYPTAPEKEHSTQKDVVVNNNHVALGFNFKGLKVLVADDDQFNIRLIQAILEKWGVQGTYCSNGKQAIQKVEAQEFDLILTDINMPEAGGVEISKFVRSLPSSRKSQIPILALTANVMEDDLAKYRKSGINGFVLKPFKEEELYQKITRLINYKEPSSSSPINFNFDDFQKFSGGDNEALRPILLTFHQNLEQNINDLSKQAKNNDRNKVAELAHKLVSSFGHVHANNIVVKLRELENQIKSNGLETSMKHSVNEIVELSMPIITQLEEKIEELV